MADPDRWHHTTLRPRVALKFVHRYRFAAAAVTAAAVALIVAGSVAVWQAQVAGAERAKQVRERARSVLFDYRDRIADPGAAPEARQRSVQEALEYLDDLAREAADDRDLMRDVAGTYERVAALQGSSSRVSSGTRPAANLDDTAAAQTSQQKAVTIRESLVRQTGSEADRLALAKAYLELGRLYGVSGPAETALLHLQNAIQILEALLASATGEEVRSLLATSYLTIAGIYRSPGDPDLSDTRTALAYLRGALKMEQALVADFPAKIEHQHGLAVTYRALGLLYSAMGESEEALEQIRNAVTVMRKIVAAQPESAVYRRELAVQLENTGTLLAQRKDTTQALEHFREALSIYEQLKAGDELIGPDVTKPDELKREMAKCDAGLGTQ